MTNITPQVDRGRRYRYVLLVTVFCLVTSAVFTAVVAFGFVAVTYMSVVTAFIESMNAIATAVILAYIGGSVVDYSLGTPRIFNAVTADNKQKADSAAESEAKG